MKSLSLAESERWLGFAGFGDFSHRQPPPGVHVVVCENLENDARPAMSTYVRARLMANWFWEFRPEQVLVRVFEWGIWRDSENDALYYSWRRYLGSHTLLEDEPGHLFLSFEQEHAISLIQMAMIFGWGITAAVDNGDMLLTFDHDGHVHAVSRIDGRAGVLAKWLSK